MGQHIEAVQAWEDGLKLLETSVERVDELGEEKIIDWINISLQTAQVVHRLGTDGPGVSHKYQHVCYTPSKMTEAEEAEWKIEQFQKAVRHFKGVLERIPAGNMEIKRKIRLQLARALYDLKQFDEAMKIYEDGFSNDGDPQWLYKAAECLWQQEKKEQAYTRLQQLIGTDPTFADAYGMLATYFTEKNDTTNADESMCKYKFYSWIPSFCRHIEYNPENLAIIEELNSDNALECVNTTLANDESRRSTEFLAAICYRHYHGSVENKAFEELEKRAKASEGAERDFIGSTLMNLIKDHQSVCTVKGAANALAGMKHEDIFEVLEYLLPQDTNPIFSMDIPTALGKLGDPKAIPLLMKIIENPMSQANEDSDSSDGIFSSGGKNRLVIESCLALATFFNDEKAKEVLMNGINNQQTHEACLAVLCDILEIGALIKASRITEQEIQHWHEDFLNHCPSGRLDKQAFIEYYKKLYPREETNKSIEHIFHMIDVNNDGTVDFHELLIVIVLIDHLNDLESRLSFVFDIWDDSEDEHIDQKELENMISAMYDRAGITDRKGDQHPKKRAKEIIAKLDISGDKKLSKEEFIIGCKNDLVIRNLFAPDT
ncbi:unnamed protein product [Rotaria sordida]|uniref:EF-hand domain-containing protein n=1 Tax=Rotaria sordida TaxID=392033 RepID=A0A814URR1_9BILA|nr:unnamed protein product [Rotaria sordida]CAF1179290.1 unnamed protein product [Rotaria sordida]